MMIRCPKCHKRFPSTSALIQHMEAPRARCGIRAYKEFAHALDEATGGIIQVSGYDEDGLARLAARSMENELETTIIGVDLSSQTKKLTL